MITADDLRKISDRAIAECPAQAVEMALKAIEQKVKLRAAQGHTSYSANTAMMVDGLCKYPSFALQQVVSRKLKELGYSYEEKMLLDQCWFTVTW